MSYFISRLILKLFFKIYLRMRVYGRENIPKNGAFILASNHVSYLDPPVLGCACPRPLNYMAKEELFRNWAFGALLRSYHVFPVRRGEGDPGAIKEAMRRLKAGGILLVFPEGTRSETGQIQKAQVGIGYLGLMAGVPILPAYVEGAREVLPRGAKGIRPAAVSVYFGKMIEPSRLKFSGDKREASQQLADYVVEEIVKIQREKGVV
jgi:1-acyl-sn-glycerol-3-phosphate acyltransferase